MSVKHPVDFWDKVDVSSPDECWEWREYRYKGYGRVRFEGKSQRAARVSYRFWAGDIPDGLTVDHLCRNRACVNPLHLEAVTNRENILRGNGPTAKNARKTHCKHGHEFTSDNIYYISGGRRNCVACRRISRQRKVPA